MICQNSETTRNSANLWKMQTNSMGQENTLNLNTHSQILVSYIIMILFIIKLKNILFGII